MCTFCNEHLETLEHVFWKCTFSQSFWKNVTEWLTKNLKQLPDLHFSMLTCLGLIPSSTILISHTFLIARRLIYIIRIRGVIPKQSAFERLLFKTRELEQNSALQLNELKKFHKKVGRFQICRTKTSTSREQLGNIFVCNFFSQLFLKQHCCFSLSYLFFFTLVRSIVLNSTSCNTYCKLL